MQQNRFPNWQPPAFDKNGETKWGWTCLHAEMLRMGKNTDIGKYCLLNAKYGIIIGDNVQVGGGTCIYSEDTIGGCGGRVILRKNCKIGAGAVLLPFSVVGENSIVGALSKVDRVIPANEIWAGNPIKKIGDVK